MSEIDPWKIVKWILIVLVAGFIGQFGKMLATHILQRIRGKQGKSGSPGKEPAPRGGEIPAAGTAAAPANPAEDPGKIAKERKKELKALAKIKKKGTGGKEGGGDTNGPPRDGDGR